MNTALLPDACIEWVLRSSTVMGAAWLMSFIPRIPAALRHTWIVAAMLAALVMPLLISALPSWSPGPLTRLVPVHSGPKTGSVVELPAAKPVSFVGATSASPVNADAPFVTGSVAFAPPAEKSLSMLSVWFIGTTLLALRLLIAALTWHRIVRSAESLRGPWRMDVRLTSRALAPVSGGLWRSIVLLPASSIHWTHGRMNAVLVHEEEHLRRRDAWWLLFGHVLCTVQWFNPFAWLIHRRAAILREEACDAAALHRGVPAAEYADALLALASPCGLSAITSSMARRTGLERRIRSVLHPSRLRQSVSRPATLISLAGLCGFTLCSSILRSQEKPVPSSSQSPAPESADDASLNEPPDFSDYDRQNPIAGEVVLDPGGWESSPASGEATVTAAQILDLSVRIKDRLEVRGLKVFLTRSSATVCASEERIRLIQQHPAAVVLSIQPGDYETKEYKGMAAVVLQGEPGLSRSMVLAHDILTKAGPAGGMRLPPVYYADHPLLTAAAKNPAALVLHTGAHPRDEAAWRDLYFIAADNLREDQRKAASNSGRPFQILTNSGSSFSGDVLRVDGGDGIVFTDFDGDPCVIRWTADHLEYAIPGGSKIDRVSLSGGGAIQILSRKGPTLITGAERATYSFSAKSVRIEGRFQIKNGGLVIKGESTASVLESNGSSVSATECSFRTQ